MDAQAISERLVEERQVLRQVIDALRLELDQLVSPQVAVVRRRHFRFLGEILRRHYTRVFDLCALGVSAAYACDWQSDDTGDQSTVEVSQLRDELDDIMTEAQTIDGEDLAAQTAGRKRLQAFLFRLENYLDREPANLATIAAAPQPAWT